MRQTSEREIHIFPAPTKKKSVPTNRLLHWALLALLSRRESRGVLSREGRCRHRKNKDQGKSRVYVGIFHPFDLQEFNRHGIQENSFYLIP